MPRLTAAEEFLAEEEPLELPYRGKVYAIPALDAERWVRLMALDAVGLALRHNGNDATQIAEEDLALARSLSASDMLRVNLGDVYEQLVADNVPPRVIQAASRTAGVYHRYGLEAAERAWVAALGGVRAPAGEGTAPPAPPQH